MKKELVVISILAILVFISACAPKTETKTGTLVLQITDKQVSGLEKLEITISQVEVHKDGNWSIFSNEEKAFDLMQLNGTKEIIGAEELEVGKYTQIRLNVSKAIATINGTENNVKVPSDKIKLANEFDILENQTTELIIDFSPESVKESGNKYIMTPVIKIIIPSEFENKRNKTE